MKDPKILVTGTDWNPTVKLLSQLDLVAQCDQFPLFLEVNLMMVGGPSPLILNTSAPDPRLWKEVDRDDCHVDNYYLAGLPLCKTAIFDHHASETRTSKLRCGRQVQRAELK